MAPDSGALTIRSWPNAIMHLDADAFFASCEQAVHPELKGLPVVTGQERNIVASMSYEAKRLGIKRATAVWEARKICPDLVVVPSDYETYSLMSKRIFAIMRRFTPAVEEYSIDEAFAELNGLRRVHHKGYPEIASDIRVTVEKELDLPVSAGISLTKSLAKLASKYQKPRGFTVVPGYKIHLFLAKLTIDKVCGIGPNGTALLNKKGVHTILDYVRKSELWAKSVLGKIGVELWHELRGNKVYEVSTEEKTTYASVSKTKTFTPPSKDYNYVKAQLYRNTESAFIKLRRYHLRAKRLIVFLREQDFKSYGMEADFSRPTSSPFEAFEYAEKLLKQIYKPGKLYRLTGVVLTCLEDDNSVQFELFESPLAVLRHRHLAKSIDQINELYGKHTVGSGMGLFLRKNKKESVRDTGRNMLCQRKQNLLKGETFRQRLGIPLVQIKV